MERFTVYPHPDNRGYLLNIQADSMGHLGSKVVIPLLQASEYRLPASRLNPQFEILGKQYVLLTQSMGAMPVKLLNQAVCNLSDRAHEIVAAIDVLFNGV
ncbi:plasmid maintenance protein CcdB [Paraburkholderia madseniana]|uniref:Toxin CcdB n=1 Tax=Paraburkholderia madseniana TaxID=2599607 RepID=A0A6N6WN02_9BURK|nr:CcdB family protein [Paraburkholderia madseniana]KAE8761244.1 plasmid maintenance protein CcdB [Paraburkholderia madseniana]